MARTEAQQAAIARMNAARAAKKAGVMVSTVEDQEQEARREQVVAERKAIAKNLRCYIIKSPALIRFRKTRDARYAPPPVDMLPVHRHVVVDPETNKVTEIPGGYIRLIDGRGFTTNASYAQWIKENWGENGYVVEEKDPRKAGLSDEAVLSLLDDSDDYSDDESEDA